MIASVVTGWIGTEYRKALEIVKDTYVLVDRKRKR